MSYAYDYKNPVFQEVSFEVNEGELWGVLGKNGAGKTSLLEVLMGFRWADVGDLKICDLNVRSIRKDFLQKVSFLSHDIRLAGNQKIKDFFDFHSYFYPEYSKEIEKELLEYFSIDPEINVGVLSTGQQKKIQIIAALSSNTKLIIIDEVTAVLDPETRARLYIKLHEHSKHYKKGIILATNLVDDLEIYADKILYFENGKTVIHLPNELKNIVGKL